MKLLLSKSLRNALYSAVAAASLVSNTVWAATTVVNTNNNIVVSGTDSTAAMPAVNNNSKTITFDATTGSSTIVTYTGTLQNMQELNINSDGATLQALAGNTGDRYITVVSGGLTVNANGNFTLDLVNGYTTGGSQYQRNFSVGSNSAIFNIATGKTFSVIGDMVGDAGGSFNIAGGGTLHYTHSDVNDGSHNQHNTGTTFNISSNSTLDLSNNEASKMSTLLLGGTVSLDSGNLKLMTGDVTLSNDLSLTGVNSITGASNLTLTGELTLGVGSFIDFGSSNVDLSSITLNLDDFETGITYEMFKTTGDFTGWSDTGTANFILGGGLTADDVEWTYNDVSGIYSLTLVSDLPETLTWSGGSGDLAVGSTNWNDSKVFANRDSIIIQGAGGSLSVDSAGVTLGGLTVSGDSNYELLGGSITMDGTSGAPISFVKNGSGTLSMMSDNSIVNVNKQINAGTLFVGSNNALGTGQVQIAADSQLQIGENLTVDTGVATTYERTTTNYTVNVGTGSTLTDNVNLKIGGGEVTITGGGTYEIWGFTLSQTNNQTDILVDTDTTLVIKGEAMDKDAGQGSFMMGNWSQANQLTIKGTVDTNAGISVRDGSGQIISVEAGGELIMRKGLAAVTKDAAKTVNINVASEGTLTLFDKDYTGAEAGTIQFTATVNMSSGATLQAGETGTTTVAENINFATDGSYNFAVATGNTLDYQRDLSVGAVNMVGDGALTTNSLTLNSGAESLSITSNNAGRVTVQNQEATKNAQLTANAITGASLSDVNITGIAAGTSITESTLNNATLTNVSIDTSSVTFTGDVSLTNSKLTGLTIVELGDTVVGEEEMLTFDIQGLNVTSIEGSLTLDLGDLGVNFMDAYNAGETIAFNLDGIAADEFKTDYTNVTLNIDGLLPQQVRAMVTSSGEVQLLIPEPSTVTLSLLALGSLLARRRRKVA